MPKQTINNIPGAIPALPVFSQAVISKGMVYVSGSTGCYHDYKIVGGIREQTRAALSNMKALLEGSGSGLEHVVKLTAYLSDMTRDFVAFNETYAEYFADQAVVFPARSCVGVVALPMGAFVGVECIAELASGEE